MQRETITKRTLNPHYSITLSIVKSNKTERRIVSDELMCNLLYWCFWRGIYIYMKHEQINSRKWYVNNIEGQSRMKVNSCIYIYIILLWIFLTKNQELHLTAKSGIHWYQNLGYVFYEIGIVKIECVYRAIYTPLPLLSSLSKGI